MTASKDDSKKELTLSGNVVLKTVGKGSKSEHTAVSFETANGSFILRRAGGNPFHDPELQKLVGKEITATGTVADNLFFIKAIQQNKK